LVLLLVGGVLVPLGKLPHALGVTAKGLPAAALSGGLHSLLGGGHGVPLESWVVLALWAAVAPIAAALTFRWE
jgi:ABC-2 type transport system permease protein